MPPLTFLDLPAELRNQIYSLLLLYSHSLTIDKRRAREIPPLKSYIHGTALFLANKTISHESLSLFYGSNQFDLRWIPAADILTARNTIGRANAAFMRTVCINIPKFKKAVLEPSGLLELDDTHSARLDAIKECFPNLHTLVVHVGPLGTWDPPGVLNFRIEALEILDATFRRVSAVQQIIAIISFGWPGKDVEKWMEDLGWRVRGRWFRDGVYEDYVIR